MGTLCEHCMCDHSNVSTLCVGTLCEHSMGPLYVSTVCVTTLCVGTLCEHSMGALYM